MTIDPSAFKKPVSDPGLYRNQVVLLLDISGTMDTKNASGVARIEQLSSALGPFLKEDIKLTGMINDGEIAIGLFNHTLEWAKLGHTPVHPSSPFYRMNALDPWNRKLTAFGTTKIADAVVAAVEAIDTRRVQVVKDRLARRYKPQIFLITDGEPDGDQDMQAVIDMLRKRSLFADSADFLFFTIGVHGADMKMLGRMAPDSHYELRNESLRELLRWVSDAVRVSNDPDASSSAPKTAQRPHSPEYENVKRRINPKFINSYDDYDG